MRNDASGVLVLPAAFEGRLQGLRDEIEDPRAGLFGPASMMWRVQREAGVFLGAGAALLLQTAHPFVAQGIADHSNALADPLARYYRTFRPVFAMVFGSADEAFVAAKRVRGVHARIRGTFPEAVGSWPAGSAYAADDADALFWVHATLWHTSIAVYERLVAPLSATDKDMYTRESARFGALFGIPDAALSRRWQDFAACFDAVAASDALGVGSAGHLIGNYFVGDTRGSFGRLLPKWYRSLTASLLPPRLAQAFELPSVTTEEVERLWRRLRAFRQALPPFLRYVGPYQMAQCRVAGRKPGLVARLVNHVWLGGTPSPRWGEGTSDGAGTTPAGS